MEAIFYWLGFDAVTLHPYSDKVALQPFLERADKCSIILCWTSNPGSREFQDLEVGDKLVWEVVAECICREWNMHNNCMLVVAANYPDELKRARKLVDEMTLLILGVGTQSESIHRAVAAGMNAEHKGMILNCSGSIIFAEDPHAVARQMQEEINRWVRISNNFLTFNSIAVNFLSGY